MSRIAAFIMVTIDGYYEGPEQAFDFWVTGEDFDAFSVAQLDGAAGLVFGRHTYTGMAQYWPMDDAAAAAPEIAHRMNTLPKLVVSQRLVQTSWQPTTIVRTITDLAAHANAGTGELLVLGSPTLTASLAEAGLLDELRIMINPVAIGAGESIFQSLTGRLRLSLIATRAFSSGNLLLSYAPERRKP